MKRTLGIACFALLLSQVFLLSAGAQSDGDDQSVDDSDYQNEVLRNHSVCGASPYRPSRKHKLKRHTDEIQDKSPQYTRRRHRSSEHETNLGAENVPNIPGAVNAPVAPGAENTPNIPGAGTIR